MFQTMRARIEQPIKAYLTWWHGAPTEPMRQYVYYRCELCRGLVTWKQIATGGCKCGVGSRVRGAHLTFFEKARLLIAPWTV